MKISAPSSKPANRQLAYLYYVSGNKSDALSLYKQIALDSILFADWNNLAFIAQELGQVEISIYSLQKIFSFTAISKENNAWLVFLGLLQQKSMKDKVLQVAVDNTVLTL